METIIQNSAYSLDASGKTITLTDTSIKLEQILNIKNLAQHQDIYDSQRTNKNTLTSDPNTPGVFHFSYDGTMQDTDTLQIVVDLPYISVTGIDGGSP